MTQSKKKGEPKKVVTTAPEKTVKNLAYYKNLAKNLMTVNDKWATAYDHAIKEKEEWFQHADKAHKENEALVELVKQIVDDTINNLVNVKAKFNPKTKEL